MPGKDKLIVRSPRPINLETPLRELTADVTPTDLFFVRNNYDGPVIDPAAYVLTVDGEVENPLTLRLDDLRRLEAVTQTITLECAGNGRSFHKPPASGLQWENGAVGTAVGAGSGSRTCSGWRGPGRPRSTSSRTGTTPRRRPRRRTSSGAIPSRRRWSLTR